MTLEFGSKTDLGKVRKNNEDNFTVDPAIGLFVVADGMGGHNSGEVASKIATDLIKNNLNQLMRKKTDQTGYSKHLLSSLQLANQAIYEASQNYKQNQGMGTTVVAVLSHDKMYTLGWVGDSRIYLVRHKNIQQLTTDHSLVQEQISKGLIKPEQAEFSEYKNILTRALGIAEKVEADVIEKPSLKDDYLILCTDGLTRAVSDAKILEVVMTIKDPQAICDKLVDLANENGGKDNCTVVVVYNKQENFFNRLLKSVAKTN
ncbi:MAG: Stp1/IreP family PP2C-type Ser/Thr phosphatase [Elusimicrobia bacterium]|nr:Stp1/IreP family PP2C-type Ser/Thr phosphatase [Candidatus Liberimonas magnetica]